MFTKTIVFRLTAVAGLIASASSSAFAQAAGDPPMDHSKMGHSMTMAVPDPLGVPMNRGGSGTTWIPDAVQLPTFMVTKGKWDLMLHGFAFAQYNHQGEKRGDSQFGALNWGMFMASRQVKGGRFQARTMLSIDAATVGPRGYPLLLQSGEVYGGKPLHDRQHPHDFFMELGVTYERPITKRVGVALYAAPSGEPALGPVAFMHRPSAMDLPTAPISHHWQDATHVSFGVLSAGLFTNKLKIEASSFNGREPNEHRWDFDKINLDSYSGRLSFNPDRHWALTAGYGYLKSPEALHPDVALRRFVASAMYGREFRSAGQWATTLVYGTNKHDYSADSHNPSLSTGARAATILRDVVSEPEGPARSHTVLLESELVLCAENTLFARAEYAQKSPDDLVVSDVLPGPLATDYRVQAYSVGYVRELKKMRGATLGLGGMITMNRVPTQLETVYGSQSPMGGVVFLRVRPVLKRNSMSMEGMKH